MPRKKKVEPQGNPFDPPPYDPPFEETPQPEETPIKEEVFSENKEEKKMSFFVTDHKEAGGFEPFEPGEYEVIFTEAKVDQSKAGNPMIKATLTVRNDYEQANQKRKIFENLTQTPKAMFKFQQVAKALAWEQGKAVDTLEEFAAAILFQAVRVKTNIKTQEGYEPSTNIVAYNPSKAANYDGSMNTEAAADPFAVDGKPIDISDDDLPF